MKALAYLRCEIALFAASALVALAAPAGRSKKTAPARRATQQTVPAIWYTRTNARSIALWQLVMTGGRSTRHDSWNREGSGIASSQTIVRATPSAHRAYLDAALLSCPWRTPTTRDAKAVHIALRCVITTYYR